MDIGSRTSGGIGIRSGADAAVPLRCGARTPPSFLICLTTYLTNHFVCDGFAITNESRELGSRRARLAKSVFRGINPLKTRDITIFAPSHETRSSAKILFAYAEKDEGAKTAANEIIFFAKKRRPRSGLGVW
jgi:hypothetical protein